MIGLTIIGTKKSVWFNVADIMVVMEARNGGTAIFTRDGEEWVVLEELCEVLSMVDTRLK